MHEESRSHGTVALSELEPGERGVIVRLEAAPRVAQRLRELGLSDGAEISPRFRSMLGDPTAYEVRGTLLALRRSDAARIGVRRLSDAAAGESVQRSRGREGRI